MSQPEDPSASPDRRCQHCKSPARYEEHEWPPRVSYCDPSWITSAARTFAEERGRGDDAGYRRMVFAWMCAYASNALLISQMPGHTRKDWKDIARIMDEAPRLEARPRGKPRSISTETPIGVWHVDQRAWSTVRLRKHHGLFNSVDTRRMYFLHCAHMQDALAMASLYSGFVAERAVVAVERSVHHYFLAKIIANLESIRMSRRYALTPALMWLLHHGDFDDVTPIARVIMAWMTLDPKCHRLHPRAQRRWSWIDFCDMMHLAVRSHAATPADLWRMLAFFLSAPAYHGRLRYTCDHAALEHLMGTEFAQRAFCHRNGIVGDLYIKDEHAGGIFDYVFDSSNKRGISERAALLTYIRRPKLEHSNKTDPVLNLVNAEMLIKAKLRHPKTGLPDRAARQFLEKGLRCQCKKLPKSPEAPDTLRAMAYPTVDDTRCARKLPEICMRGRLCDSKCLANVLIDGICPRPVIVERPVQCLIGDAGPAIKGRTLHKSSVKVPSGEVMRASGISQTRVPELSADSHAVKVPLALWSTILNSELNMYRKTPDYDSKVCVPPTARWDGVLAVCFSDRLPDLPLWVNSDGQDITLRMLGARCQEDVQDAGYLPAPSLVNIIPQECYCSMNGDPIDPRSHVACFFSDQGKQPGYIQTVREADAAMITKRDILVDSPEFAYKQRRTEKDERVDLDNQRCEPTMAQVRALQQDTAPGLDSTPVPDYQQEDLVPLASKKSTIRDST